MNIKNTCLVRQCVCCKENKPATKEYFYSDKNRPLGLMYRCKLCDKKRPDKRNNRWSTMTEDQKKKHYSACRKHAITPIGMAASLASSYRSFDKERGYENNINKFHILDVRTQECIYCGFTATGFDRLDNKKGHTIANCIPCCIECNTARMDIFTFDEMVEIGKTIRLIKLKRLHLLDRPHFELA